MKALSDGSMQADGEDREGQVLKLCLMGGKAEGNTLMRSEPAEEERGRTAPSQAQWSWLSKTALAP